ncbi:MAG: hypothetical protein ACJ8ER_17830 [Allosphingosinicella sp.]
MPKDEDVAQLALKHLFDGVLSPERFSSWKAELGGTIETLRTYAFGEIFWRKSIGRPHTPALADGFTIEAMTDESIFVVDADGSSHWQPWQLHYQPSWWDGKDDDEFWRVGFIVPDIQDGRAVDGIHNRSTAVLPRLLNDVWWIGPEGAPDIVTSLQRMIVGDWAVFVKGDTSVHLSFEVMVKSLTVFDSRGLQRP